MQKLLMIAGPNGAGKTTAAKALLLDPGRPYKDFLNADHIAHSLSPLHPEAVTVQAGKLMIERFMTYLDQQTSFAFETTASGILYAKHLKKAKERGYELNLVYLWLDSPKQAIERVAWRVVQGGHSIPEEDIQRRYYRGLRNILNLYLPLSDTAIFLDNSTEESGIRKTIALKETDHPLEIKDEEAWKTIQEAANGKA
jgi:predicted ABC-type ATPase